MKLLVTGSAGFIGSMLSLKLLERGNDIIGVDNHNKYYDTKLKNTRNNILLKKKNFQFYKIDLRKNKELQKLQKKNFDVIIHLAAQAGIRYSIKNPREYLTNNIEASFNILEFSKKIKVKHLMIASSSSVYGLAKGPFRENFPSDHPIQFYAASKKSVEIMSHSYSYLYNLPITNFRLFTVYGPYGRPDMALFGFTDKIYKNQKVKVFNYGKHARDFTYIDDAIKIIYKLMKSRPKKKVNWKWSYDNSATSTAPYRIVNIASGRKVQLLKFLKYIEQAIKKNAKKVFVKQQAGDMENTFASTKILEKIIKKYKVTKVQNGILSFIEWYLKWKKK